MECYQINRSRVVYEILSTEVIAIDFNTGNYYALLHIGKHVWQMIEKQVPLEAISRVISNQYKQDFVKVLSDIRQFIGQLVENELIEPADEVGEVIQIDSHEWPYAPPQVQTYTDVQNLLLLDPVHEVTDAGWPEKLSLDEQQPVS